MATTCAISASAALVTSVECVCEYYNIAVWKAKSNMTQSYIRLSVEYYQESTIDGSKSTTRDKDIRYNVDSVTVTLYPEANNKLVKKKNVIAEFANGVTVYPENINDEII